MKAVEVIEQYKSGRRDFRGESLRGCDFKNQDLSGADFSGCDLRGANFSRANLTEVKFEKARAGLRKRWMIFLLLVAFVLILISSFFSALMGIFIAYIFDQSSIANQILGLLCLTFLLLFCILTWRKNLLAGAVAGAGAVAIAGAVAGSVAGSVGVAVAGAGAIVATGAVIEVGAVAGSGVVTVARVVAVAGSGAGAVAVAGIVAVAGAVGVAGAVVGKVAVEEVVGVGVAVAVAVFFTWIGWLTLKQEHRDPWLHRIVIAFAGLGGTSFFKANLTATDFTGAILKNTNFNQAKLNKTIFKQAIKLELARPGKTLLVNPQVRELLINPGKGADQDLTKADLRGANLDGANLQRTNLRLADLSQASFKYANLREANLTEVNGVNADLSYATLTGACVENWNIDATTQLAEVDCQYIYLLNNQKERRPSSGEFEPGEFTQLFAEVFDTVDLIFRQGVDWKAFINAMNQVQVQNEEIPLELQSIEKKGDGLVVIKFHVPPDTNKEKIHQEFNQIYQRQLAAVEAEYQDVISAYNALLSEKEVLLSEKEAEITKKEVEIIKKEVEITKKEAEITKKEAEINDIKLEQISAMMDLLRTVSNPSIPSININNIFMPKNLDSDQEITIGDINNSVVNLGEIIGDVTNTINQIPVDNSPQNQELKALLQELTEAIKTETNLDDDEKAEAANQVKKIAQASQNPDDSALQTKAKKAVNLLETISKGLEPASKLFKACQKVLPLILGLLGL